MSDCPEEFRETEPLTVLVEVPEPFDQGRIVILRGEWVQCEARRDRERFARRIYFTNAGFQEALFQLLMDLQRPEGLPVWGRGEYISGYRRSE